MSWPRTALNRLRGRWLPARDIAGDALDSFPSIAAVCPVCETETRMVETGPWLRDQFVCRNCLCVPRERALMAALDQFFPDWRTLSVHEASPALRASAKLKRECSDYSSSFFDPALAPGEIVDGRDGRNESLERLTFDDACFDLFITQDVFEHLFRPDLAIKEVARTLKAGGAHVCTVPIGRKSAPSIRRSVRSADGLVTHRLEPIYHGSADNSPALVTIDYGYDIADYFDLHSGLSTTIVYIDDMSRGIRAEFIEVLISRKDVQPHALDADL